VAGAGWEHGEVLSMQQLPLPQGQQVQPGHLAAAGATCAQTTGTTCVQTSATLHRMASSGFTLSYHTPTVAELLKKPL